MKKDIKKVYLIENINKNIKENTDLPEVGYFICRGISSGYNIAYVYTSTEEDFREIFHTERFLEYLKTFNSYEINRDMFMNVGADINKVLTLDPIQFKTEDEMKNTLNSNNEKIEKMMAENEIIEDALLRNEDSESVYKRALF